WERRRRGWMSGMKMKDQGAGDFTHTITLGRRPIGTRMVRTHSDAHNGVAHALGRLVRMVDVVSGSGPSQRKEGLPSRWKTVERTRAGAIPEPTLNASPKVRPASACWRIDSTKVPSEHLGLRKPARKRMLPSSAAGGSLQTS